MSRIYMQKYERFGEAPVPRSRTWLEDVALHNLLPHLYPARLGSLRENATAENLKREGQRRYYNKIKGLCCKHRPPFAGFSTRQVPRWSLTCSARKALVLARHTRRTNWIACISARQKHHPLFPMRTCLQRHMKPFYIQPYPISYSLVRLPGEYHDSNCC